MVSHILLYENSAKWIILSQIPLFIWFSFVEENAEKEAKKKINNKKIKKRKIRLWWILNPSSQIWVEWNSQLSLQFSNWCALVRISLSFDCYMLLHFSRQAGHRVGEHLERIIPMIVQYSRVENDDELREYCIQVSRNPFFELPACKTVPFTCAVMFYSKSTICISELLVQLHVLQKCNS